MSDERTPGDETIEFGPFRLSPEQSLLTEDGKPVALGARALDILIALARRAGETVTKEELFAQVWPGIFVEDGTLRVHIASLRKALRDGTAGRRFIVTVAGQGYSLVAPVARSAAPGAAGAVPAEAPPSRLPTPLTRMVGRQDVVTLLTAQLPERRFMTVVGPGGIGKTTVAIAVADALRGTYRDGVQFVDLAPIADPALVPSAVAALLGVPIRIEDPIPALVAALGTRQMLLVLDGCEHLVLAVARLAEAIFAGAPEVHILATSREALRAEGERVQRLPALEAPPAAAQLSASEAATFPAVQLFVERAAAVLDAFVLTDENAPVIAEICRSLDGIALAIELAAGRVDAFGVNGVAARLDDRFRLLTGGHRTALPRHQTLLAALDWSYQLLTEDERIVLRRLSVLAGSFTLDAASAVAAGAAIGATDVMDHVANLVSASLVSVDLAGETAYYRLLDTTRAYARTKLDESGELDAVARRHAEYFGALFRRIEADISVTPRAQWLVEGRRQLDNLRAALDWAFSARGDAALGIALTAAGVALWTSLSLVYECRARVEQALARIRSGPHGDARAEMQLHVALGGLLLFTTGAGPELSAAFEQALRVAESLGDDEYRLRALWGLWTGRLNNGEYPAALTMAERLHALAARGSSELDLAVADRALAFSWHFLGDQLKARAHLETMAARSVGTARRALTIRYQFDPLITGRMRYGWILWVLGHPDQAKRAIEANLDDLWSTDHAVSICIALGLGPCPVALAVGDYDDAERYIDALAEQAARYSLSLWQGWAQCLRGVLQIRLGRVEEGVALLRGQYLWPEYAIFFGQYARALGASGEVAQGLAAIDDAIAQAEQRGGAWHMAELLRFKGELLSQQAPQDPAGEEHLRRSLDWARRQQTLSWELRAAISLAELHRSQGRLSEARSGLASVYGRFAEGLETADLKTARKLLDQLH